MQKMDHKKCLAKLLLYFGILHYLPRATSQIEAFVGDPVSIPCNVTGTFQLPEWTFGLITITNQGNPLINPAFTRLQYASDQKNLRLTNAQLNDTGNYVCTHTAGTATTSLTVKKKSKNKEGTNGKKIETAKCACFVPAEVVVTVVIIICSYILINAYKECKHDKNKMEDKQKKKIKDVVILTIVEVLLFITVSIWFIVIQATVEDFEKLTQTELNATIALLVVEIVVFVQGVIAIFVLWKNRGKWWKEMEERSVP